MSDTAIIEIALRTMLVALKLSAPILVTSLVIAIVFSIDQRRESNMSETDAAVPSEASR